MKEFRLCLSRRTFSLRSIFYVTLLTGTFFAGWVCSRVSHDRVEAPKEKKQLGSYEQRVISAKRRELCSTLMRLPGVLDVTVLLGPLNRPSDLNSRLVLGVTPEAAVLDEALATKIREICVKYIAGIRMEQVAIIDVKSGSTFGLTLL